jgi:hypothetical protein
LALGSRTRGTAIVIKIAGPSPARERRGATIVPMGCDDSAPMPSRETTGTPPGPSARPEDLPLRSTGGLLPFPPDSQRARGHAARCRADVVDGLRVELSLV